MIVSLNDEEPSATKTEGSRLIAGWHDLSHERQPVQVQGDERQHDDHAKADDDRGGSFSGDLPFAGPERMRSWSVPSILRPEDQQRQRRRQGLVAMGPLV